MIDLIFSTSSKIKLQNMKIQIKLENISYELDSLDDLIDLIKLGSPPFLTLQQNTLCIDSSHNTRQYTDMTGEVNGHHSLTDFLLYSALTF